MAVAVVAPRRRRIDRGCSSPSWPSPGVRGFPSSLSPWRPEVPPGRRSWSRSARRTAVRPLPRSRPRSRRRTRVSRLDLERAAGGRSQLYRATTPEGPLFLKVYGQDSRDADLLYRSYRSLVLRESGDRWLASALEREVEHEALLLLLAGPAGVACPSLRAVVPLPDGSMVLAMEDVGGRRLDELSADELDPSCSTRLWRQVRALHAAGLAHRSLRTANVLVTGDGAPVLIDFGAASASSSARAQAIDRAELLASLAAAVGVDDAVASAARVLDPADLAAAMPYLQPLALSAATRRAVPGSTLRALRDRVAEATGREAAPLERLVRVRPADAPHDRHADRRLLHPAPPARQRRRQHRGARVGQLALARGRSGDVGLHVRGEPRSGCWRRRAERLPFVPTTQVALASSFVNRVTSGERRRHGAQRALHAEGRRPARRGGHRRRAERRWPAGSSTSCCWWSSFAGRARGRGGVPHPEQQQAARRHRRRAGPRRPRLGDASRSEGGEVEGGAGAAPIVLPASRRSPGRRAGCARCSPARQA